MRDLRGRIAATADRFAVDTDDGPRGVVLAFREASYATRADLIAATTAAERRNRRGGNPDRIVIETVSLCRPGEEPSQQDRGEFVFEAGGERSMSGSRLVPVRPAGGDEA